MFEQTIDGRKFAEQRGGLVGHRETQIYTAIRRFQHGFVRKCRLRFDKDAELP
jgi:hypothetical protein